MEGKHVAGQKPGGQSRWLGRFSAVDLRRLRWLSVALPILGLIAFEIFRALFVENDPVQQAEHIAIAAVAAIGILGFSLFMFQLIERAEAQVVRQNRELTAINAVSTAVQGELGVEQIIDAALNVVIERTNATEASVVVFARDQARNGGLERRVVRTTHASVGDMGGDVPHLVDIPLTRGTSIVGRMLIHLAQGGLEPDLLTAATLNNIGHQLASAIEIGQLVGDLRRRRQEGDALYDVLLSVSSQKPLAETLDSVVRNARELLVLTTGRLTVNPSCSSLLDGAPTNLVTWQQDGSVTLGGPSGEPSTTSEERATLRVSLVSPELTIGELWVMREGAAFTERESALLHSLGELAVIAVTSARMRDGERQVAILAERERIAREMHDSLAQVLGFLHIQLRALRAKVSDADPRVLSAGLVELADVADEAYRDVREAILGLRESSRAERSLIDSLRAFLERYEHQSGIKTTLETDFDEPPRLSPQAEVHIIRVIQEALTNVRKHAAARNAVVRISSDGGQVTFTVEDDGQGFDLTKAAFHRDGGFGLHAMRERMDLIAGTLTVDSAAGKGTRIEARVPCQPVSHPIGEMTGIATA
jgi:two-component system nitrate/nitrite sensor histidine kinase NarX